MIYHIYANRQNIGDWLAARAIQSQLAPRAVRELLIDEPFVESSIQELRQAAENDLVVIGGGGLFHEYFLPFWSAFDEISRKVPFVVWGVGFCDAKEQNTRPPNDLITRTLQRSRLCVVRDQLTRAAFPELELPAPAVCPSTLLLGATKPKERSIVHSVHYGLTGHERYERLCEIVRAFATRTGRPYVELNNEIEPDDQDALNREIDFYKRAELVLSTRLHGCLIGLASGCKVMAVSADRKIDEFMKLASLEAWLLELEDLERSCDYLDRLHTQQSPRAGLFEEARAANCEIGRNVSRIADEIRIVAESRA